MARIRLTIFILCATIIFPYMSLAQGDVKRLTLSESLAIALKSNNNIIKAQYDYEEGELKIPGRFFYRAIK